MKSGNSPLVRQPALVAEWIRIMKNHLMSQGRSVAEETLYLATRWSDLVRDVRIARELALDLLKRASCTYCRGHKLGVSWSAKCAK
jgi:hypothetical protein